MSEVDVPTISQLETVSKAGALFELASSRLYFLGKAEDEWSHAEGIATFPGSVAEVVIAGQSVWTLISNEIVQGHDIGTPSQPVAAGTIVLGPWANGEVLVSGDHLFVFDGQQGNLVYDVSDPFLPKYLDTLGAHWLHAVSGDRYVVFEKEEDSPVIQYYRRDELGNWSQIGTHALPCSLRSLALSDEVVVAMCLEDSTYVLKWDEDDLITEVSVWEAETTARIHDISLPSFSPALAFSPGFADGIDVLSGVAAIGSSFEDPVGLSLFDVSGCW